MRRSVRWAVGVVLGAAGFLLLSGSPTPATPTCTNTFVGPTGAWTTASKWSTGAVPTSADYVCIPDGTTASLSGTATVDGINIDGTLSGAGTLTITDAGTASESELDGGVTGTSVNLTAGSLAITTAQYGGSGTLTIAPGASMEIDNPDWYGLLTAGSAKIVNNGSITAVNSNNSYPTLYLQFSANTFTNNGTLTLVDGADTAGSGPIAVPSGGLITTNDASGATIPNTITLGGRIDLTQGDLDLTQVSAPAATTSGVLDATDADLVVHTATVPSGSRLSTQGSGVVLEDAVDGAGELLVAAGTTTARTVNMTGTGTTTIATGATMSVANADWYGILTHESRKLVNNGTVSAVNANDSYPSLYLQYAANVFTNNGALELKSGADTAGGGVLINASTGTITSDVVGTSDTDIGNGVIENDGLIHATQSDVSITGGGTTRVSTGDFTSEANTRLILGGIRLGDGAALVGPTAAGTGVVTIDGTEVVIPTGATVTATGRTGLDGTLDAAGSLVVESGDFAVITANASGSGTLTIAEPAAMTISNADSYGLLTHESIDIVNEGDVVLENLNESYPALYLQYAENEFTDAGTVTMEDGADIAGSGPVTVPQGGLITTAAGTGATIVNTVELAGRARSAAGSLDLTQVTTPSGGSTTGVLDTTGAGTLIAQTVTVPSASKISTEGLGVTLDQMIDGVGELAVASGTTTAQTVNMAGSGTTTVGAGATLTITNADSYGLLTHDTRKLVNNGTMVIENLNDSYPTLYLQYAANTLTNNGLVDIKNGADTAGGGSILNPTNGTILKSTGTVESQVGTKLDNSGLVRSLTGMLNITGAFPSMTGTTLTRGTYEMVSPGKIQVPADVVRNDATILLDGPNAAMADSASANGLANLNRIGTGGTLTVKNGRVQNVGALNQEGTLVIGDGTGSQVLGTTITSSGTTTLTAATSLLRSTGTTTVSGGTLSGVGTVQAGGTGLTVNGTGTLAPGLAGPGTLSVTGNLVLGATATLAIDANGTGAGQVDKVAATGTSTINGKIAIATGFTPAIGDGAIIVSSSARSGRFTSATGGDLAGDISWSAAYGAANVTLVAARPDLTISDPTVTEGDAGTKQLDFVVTQSVPLLTTSGVTGTTSDLTAKATGAAVGASDYVAKSEPVGVGFDQTTAAFSVTINSDDIYEHDETLKATLTAPVNAAIADATGTGTITNDEAVPSMTLADLGVIEGDTGSGPVAKVVATLNPRSSFTTTADWATGAGSAGGGDYTAGNGTLSFAPGITSRSVSVPVIGDVATEADETVPVALSAGAPAGDVTLGGPATLTIRDDDAAVTYAAVSVDEPSTGSSGADITFTLSHPNPRPVDVTWTTNDGSAVAPGDFVASSSTTRISTGQTSKKITVAVNADLLVEEDEAFAVTVTGVVGGQLGTPQVNVTILDGTCTIGGTSAGETLNGTAGDDVICGFGGNDVINPGGGNDKVYGGLGNDAISGSPGNDKIYGGDLKPSTGTAGIDTLTFADSTCGVEADIYNHFATDHGGSCNGLDTLISIENLTGSAHADILRGNENANTLLGLDGDDGLYGDLGDDTLTGGNGVDYVAHVYRAGEAAGRPGVTVNLTLTTRQNTVGAGSDLIRQVEGIYGTHTADTLTGNNSVNLIVGLEGDDAIDGSAGADQLQGVEGNDTIHGGAGVDVVNGGDGTDILWGDAAFEGASRIIGGDGRTRLLRGRPATPPAATSPGPDARTTDAIACDSLRANEEQMSRPPRSSLSAAPEVPGFAWTRVFLAITLVVTNIIGAIVVFVLAALVVPLPPIADEDASQLANLIITAIYVPLAVVVGILRGVKISRRATRWLRERREPDEAERKAVLRAPARLFLMQSQLWGVAAVGYGIYNARESVHRGALIAVIVALAGVSTCAIAYLLAERVLRPLARVALSYGVPNRLGMRLGARTILAWLLGSGIFMFGILWPASPA